MSKKPLARPRNARCTKDISPKGNAPFPWRCIRGSNRAVRVVMWNRIESPFREHGPRVSPDMVNWLDGSHESREHPRFFAIPKGGFHMRLFTVILLLACSPALRAQKDFEVCQGAGAEIIRQGDSANPQREFCIGYVYATGRGVAKDMGAAVTHFRAAADKGYAPAQAVLGLHYAKGLGVTQNWTEAARWYRKAAEAGHGGAAVNLGLCYQNGNGVPQDRKEAAKWYKIAADHGDPSAPGLLAALRGSSHPAGSPPQQANARQKTSSSKV